MLTISFILLYFQIENPVPQLQKRVEALEAVSKNDIESQLSDLSWYALRHTADFDTYTALSKAEQIAHDARSQQHAKSIFLDVATQTLRSLLQVWCFEVWSLLRFGPLVSAPGSDIVLVYVLCKTAARIPIP